MNLANYTPNLVSNSSLPCRALLQTMETRSIEHRRENKIVLEIEVRPHSIGMELLWECIQIPRTKSVQRSTAFFTRFGDNVVSTVRYECSERLRSA